jgi:hypothetical protein
MRIRSDNVSGKTVDSSPSFDQHKFVTGDIVAEVLYSLVLENRLAKSGKLLLTDFQRFLLSH